MAKYCPLTVKQLAGVITLAIAALICASLCSCKSIQYVPVETVRTERVVEHDSVNVERVVHDSVTVEKHGDTVFVDRWHTEYKDRWHDRWRDSVRVDSVQVPYPVERKLSKWQTFCIDYGKVMLGASILFVCFFIAYVLKKLGLFARFRI